MAPPLTVAPPGGEREEATGAFSPAGESDPLVSNGLGSPACSSAASEAGLGVEQRRDCETSGFVGAAAPTGNYGVDVHIDTGVLGLSSGGLLSVVQDLVVAPVWMAIVWIVHALVVMLEWSFALNLLEGGGGGSVRADLLTTQAGVTAPWLPFVLAVAAVLLAYRGLVVRRVADSLGEALAMAAMTAAGLWLILDPAGSAGLASRWVQDASEGTLAVAAQGSAGSPERALGESMARLFATAVEAPWCYLEFGDVRWCREQRQLDPRLRRAALAIASRELGEAGCRGVRGACSGEGGGRAGLAVQSSARLLREARTNGELFLALPANGPARNSINDSSSLLRTLCQSDEATSCQGATAAQAQFRTNGGTWSRVGGLLLIAIGLLGLILCVGYMALRLLVAAVLALLYLLVAPAVVLAPALGERGRDLFRAWAGRLFGALAAKLIYAFLLGVVLTLMSLLGSVGGVGWWAQWLLLSAFWWSAFMNRGQLRTVAAAAPLPRPQRHFDARGELARTARKRFEERRKAKRNQLGPDVSAPPGPGQGETSSSEPSWHGPAGADTYRPQLAGAAGAEPPRGGRWTPGADDAGPGAGRDGRRDAGPGDSGSAAAGRGPAGLEGTAGRTQVPSAVLAEARGAGREGGRREAPGAPASAGDATAVGAAAAAAAQLSRIDSALAAARSSGERRRVATLEARRARVADMAGSSGRPEETPRARTDMELAARRGLPSAAASASAGTPAAAQAITSEGSEVRPPAGRGEPADPLARRRRPRTGAGPHDEEERQGDRVEERVRREDQPRPVDRAVWEDIKAVADGRKRQFGIGKP